MARAALGSLVVSLGLNAAEFTAGLTKAEYDARKFAQQLDKGIASAARGAGLALAVLGTASAAAIVAIDRLAKGAASFKDLEEKTGASAEGLASMAVAAGVAETSMNDVASASVKLTKNLTGVDDESKAAGAALAALGINIKDFKALDPAAQMEAVAKALARFEDGAAKTAVALALFGRAGADMLPFLKELGGESGRQVILTQRQIELADQYADAQARLTTQIRLQAQALAVDLIPPLLRLIDNFAEARRQSEGFFSALQTFSHLNPFADAAEDATRLAKEIADLKRRIAEPSGFSLFGLSVGQGKQNLEAELATLEKAYAVVKARERAATEGFRRSEFGGPPPRLNFAGAVPKAGRAAAERQSDAERYLESLQKQQEHLEDLTVTEQFLRDVQMGRLKDITHAQFDAIFNVTQAIDATKAQKKAEEELARAVEERARAEQQTLELYARETASIQAANDALAEEVMLMGADEKTRNEFTQAQLADTIARKENELAIRQQAGATAEQTHELERQIELLKDRQGILALKGMKQQLQEDAEAAKKFNDIFASSFADSLASVVDGTKSVSDAFKDMERSIVQAITRIAAQKIAEQIFGGGTGGGGGIGGFFASLFGGGGAGGFSGGGFGEHFAGGGVSRGGWATVGERGPELVRLPRGAQVIPNDVLTSRRAMRQTVNINVAGGVTSRTANQIAVAVGRATQRAIARDA